MDSYGTYDGRKEEPPYMSDESITQITLQKIEAEIVKRERERFVKLINEAYERNSEFSSFVLRCEILDALEGWLGKS